MPSASSQFKEREIHGHFKLMIMVCTQEGGGGIQEKSWRGRGWN